MFKGEQQTSQKNDEALFITAFPNSNKKFSTRNIIPVQSTSQDIQMTDLIKKCDQLITQCMNLNVNESLSLYKQVSSKYRLLRIGVQSQIKKIESCAEIDIQYMKKLFNNQPKMSYNFINARLDGQQLQLQDIKTVVQKCRTKIQFLQDQIG